MAQTSARLGLTLFQRHAADWRGCTRCALAGSRGGAGKVCLARGRVPCDAVFVGEAPGVSENTIGLPFVGPAGQLLDQIIERAWNAPGTEGPGYSTVIYALTNLVGCIPRGEDGNKVAPPPDEAVEACAPRLAEFIRLADPWLLIAVGKEALDRLTPGFKYSAKLHKPVGYGREGTFRLVTITHPAAILRVPTAARGLQVQQCVVRLRNAAERPE